MRGGSWREQVTQKSRKAESSGFLCKQVKLGKAVPYYASLSALACSVVEHRIALLVERSFNFVLEHGG